LQYSGPSQAKPNQQENGYEACKMFLGNDLQVKTTDKQTNFDGFTL